MLENTMKFHLNIKGFKESCVEKMVQLNETKLQVEPYIKNFFKEKFSISMFKLLVFNGFQYWQKPHGFRLFWHLTFCKHILISFQWTTFSVISKEIMISFILSGFRSRVKILISYPKENYQFQDIMWHVMIRITIDKHKLEILMNHHCFSLGDELRSMNCSRILVILHVKLF